MSFHNSTLTLRGKNSLELEIDLAHHLILWGLHGNLLFQRAWEPVTVCQRTLTAPENQIPS